MIKGILGVLLSVVLLATQVVASDIPESLKGMEMSPVDPYTSYHFKETPWTGWNKFWAISAVGGQAGDVITTADALSSDNCVEANPIFGEDPEIATIVAFKLVVAGVVYYLVEHTEMTEEERQNARNWGYGALAVTGAGAAIWNSQQGCN